MDKNEIEIKIPFFIPAIIIGIFFIIVAQLYSKNTNNTVEATTTQCVIEEKQQEVVEIEKQEETEVEVVEVVEEEQIVQEEPKTVTYTASNGKEYEIIATLNIPSLGIKYPILSKTTEALLKVSLNKYWGANPNEVGNMCILGHNYENTKFFSKLPNIKIGDIVQITDLEGKTLDYTVYETDIIDPYDNSCTSQLTDGHTEITLITCYNKGAQRFIAKARVD